MKTLLFEGAIRYSQGPTYFYYVEKENDKYYFEHGISMLGVPIDTKELNRLNILVGTEEKYTQLKEMIFTQSKRYHWYGSEVGHNCYFHFFDEKYEPMGTGYNLFDKSFEQIMESCFEYPLRGHLGKPNGNVIDKFIMCNTECYVIHDTVYEEPEYTPEPELLENKEEQVSVPYFRLANGDIYKESTIIKTGCRKQWDLLCEALFIHKNKRYPERMIVVHGWTAKDLLESKNYDLIDTYDILTTLRVSKPEGQEKLRQRLSRDYVRILQGDTDDVKFNGVCF